MTYLNWYDLFRKVYPGGPGSNSESRMGVSYVDGQRKEYKRGMTLKEYTPWAKLVSADEKMGPIIATSVSDYLNNEDVRKALHIPSDMDGWNLCTA